MHSFANPTRQGGVGAASRTEIPESARPRPTASTAMGEREQVHFWMSPNEHRALRELAEYRGTTLAALLRQLVREAIRRDTKADGAREKPVDKAS
jgi:hypothetical protein